MLRPWKNLCQEFSPEHLRSVLRLAAPNFRPTHECYDVLIRDDAFSEVLQIGRIELPDARTVVVVAVRVEGDLTVRSSKAKQYDMAKRILRHTHSDAGIFAFHDDAGRFRFSLVTVTYHGTKQEYSKFRRYTFFVDPDMYNKTFLQQMERADFSDLPNLLDAFSIEAVSDEFYVDFRKRYDELTDSVQGTDDQTLKQDFALLFAIRVIFLGFVQKKGWLGNNTKFLQDYWKEYKESGGTDTFYRDWLELLFFEAFSSKPGCKIGVAKVPFSQETHKVLQEAPYLNGELFRRKQDVDDQGLWIPDEPIGKFFDFLFQYNFTVEENDLYDEELELNPEFLGIIFERITNQDQGAVYTPREEVDLMCRLALVKWLERKTRTAKTDLYRLFFREFGTEGLYDEHQKQGDFSPAQIRALIENLENVTVCDPAAGSGAFEVGMLQILDEVLENLYSRNNTPLDLRTNAPSAFERKKAIIARSLYGVEVKRWAVWINHLRLWLALFVDMPDEAKMSNEPLLPNLTFKVRTGDSLVQRIGSKTFSVRGSASLPSELKERIRKLKDRKTEFYYNNSKDYRSIEQEELALFRAILDREIAERRKIISTLDESNREQLQLFETRAEQKRLDFTHQIERLHAEITELGAQRRSLADERPFIWSIEFPEVFFDRGGFDIIIGNPPYLSKDEIEDPYGYMDPSAYKEALLEMVRLDFPDFFEHSWRPGKFRTDRKPSRRSDLYTYFYIRSLRLLNDKGVHVFICSNSWLDVGYGWWLQEFFLRKAPLYFVIDNHARRSFARAEINTVITVAGAPAGVRSDHVVRFVAFKQPFEDVVLSDNLLEVEDAQVRTGNDKYRVIPVTVEEMLLSGSELKRSRGGFDPGVRRALELWENVDADEGTSEPSIGTVSKPTMRLGQYVGDKWGGQYLRAPDILFAVLEKGKGRLLRLGDIVEVNEGRPTGANDYFYVPTRTVQQFGIEGKYLSPALMKTRGKAFLEIKDHIIERYFLSLPRDGSWRDDKVAEYVRYGEREILPRSKTLSQKPSWWYIPVRKPADLLAPCGYGDRIWCAVNRVKAIASNSYVEIRLQSSKYLPSIFFTLNHPVGWLFLELAGRASLGGGMLKVDPIDYRQVRVVKVSQELFVPFEREVQSVFVECGINPDSDVPIFEQEPNPLSDRKVLDDVVFDALGLTEEERKDVYRAVCQLVWERIRRARSVRRSGK